MEEGFCNWKLRETSSQDPTFFLGRDGECIRRKRQIERGGDKSSLNKKGGGDTGKGKKTSASSA